MRAPLDAKGELMMWEQSGAATAVRSLFASDFDALDVVLRAAYGFEGSYVPRLREYLDAPEIAGFVAVDDGAPVGCVFGVDYGTAAYVSLMGVDPRAQRRGIGSALFDALIAWSEKRGIPTLLLDATAAGAPLYERAGFVDDGETVVYRAQAAARPASSAVREATRADREVIVAADKRAFGADRSAVLERLFDAPENAVFVGEHGAYAVAQARAIGPIIARDDATAAAMFDAALSVRAGRMVQISVPSRHAGAARLLGERGFTVARRLRHMVRGARPHDDATMLWARIHLGHG